MRKNLTATEVFAERLRKKVAGTPMAQEDRAIPLTVSIGVTGMKASDTSADDALVRADDTVGGKGGHGGEAGRGLGDLRDELASFHGFFWVVVWNA